MSTEPEAEIPASGWAAPETQADQPDSDPLVRLLHDLIGVVPEELRARLTEALRALIEALRALIDWVLARLERSAEPAPPVRDIPIF